MSQLKVYNPRKTLPNYIPFIPLKHRGFHGADWTSSPSSSISCSSVSGTNGLTLFKGPMWAPIPWKSTVRQVHCGLSSCYDMHMLFPSESITKNLYQPIRCSIYVRERLNTALRRLSLLRVPFHYQSPASLILVIAFEHKPLRNLDISQADQV